MIFKTLIFILTIVAASSVNGQNQVQTEDKDNLHSGLYILVETYKDQIISSRKLFINN